MPRLKILFAAVFFILGSLTASAQAFLWGAGGTAPSHYGFDWSDKGVSVMAVDFLGNVCIAGRYIGTTKFGSNTFASAGSHDVFIVKYSPSGTLLWATSIGGNDDENVTGIGIDGNGDTYITGHFSASAAFGAAGTLTSVGGSDVYLAKLAYANGAVMWARSGGGSGDDLGQSLAVDVSGNVYVAGSFHSTAAFGASSVVATPTGGNPNAATDIFIAKYDLLGNAQWAMRAGGSQPDSVCTIRVDAAHHRVFLLGYTSTPSSLTFGSTMVNTLGTAGTFVAAYSEVGLVGWVTPSPFLAGSSTMTVSTAGDVYVAGSGDVAILAGTNGNTMGSTMHLSQPGISGIAWSWFDNAFVITGTYIGSNVVVGGTSLSSPFASAGYAAKFDASGTAQWARSIAATDTTIANAVGTDALGNVYVAGTFAGTASFGSTLTSTLNDAVFTAKLVHANWITGTIYNDANSNHIHDPGETGMGGVPVRISGTGAPEIFLTASDGTYAAPVGQGFYTIDLPNVPLYHLCIPNMPLSTTFGTAQGGASNGNDFAIVSMPGEADMRVTLIGPNTIRPGVGKTFLIVYDNVGTIPTPSTVSLIYPAGLTVGLSTPLMTDNSVAHVASLALGMLAPGAHGMISVTLNASTTLLPGTFMNVSTAITGLPTELTPFDNSASLSLLVTNSLDPNKKHIVPQGNFTPAQIATAPSFMYTVEFQNTGTAEAIDIMLRDTLDQHLDHATFHQIASSHPCTVSMDGHGGLLWAFRGVDLPDSTANEPLSHGFVTYSVSPKTTMALNDSVVNTAYIYFDYNTAVVTNTTVTKVAERPMITRVDSLSSRRFEFANRHVVGRTFALFNRKLPASPIDRVDITISPAPSRPMVGDALVVDGRTAAWSVPYTSISANPPVQDSVMFNLGVLDSAEWTGDVVVTAHHHDGDSTVTTYAAWTAALRTDSLVTAEATFPDAHIVARSFTLINAKFPASVIDSVAIVLTNNPRYPHSGKALKIDGVVQTWSAPYTRIAAAPPARDSITFDLGLPDSSNWSGAVALVAYHSDGERDTVTYGPWTVTKVGVHDRDAMIGGFSFVNIEPNPANDEATLLYTTGASTYVTIDLVNALGHVVAVLAHGVVDPGAHSAHFSTSALAAGTYWMRMSSAIGVRTIPVVVAH